MALAPRIIPAQETAEEIVTLNISKESSGIIMTAIVQPKDLNRSPMPGERQAYTVKLDGIPAVSITIDGVPVPLAKIIAANIELAEVIVNHCRQ